MVWLIWGSFCNIDIQSIDQQYRKRVNRVNVSRSSLNKGYGVSIMSRVFDALVDCTVTCFGHEKRLFDKHGPIMSGLHRRESHLLLEQEMTLRQMFKWRDEVAGV